MNFKNISTRLMGLVVATATMYSINACSPDEFESGNGLSNPNTDASFTIEPVAGSTNKFILRKQGKDVITNKWDVGNGAFIGTENQEVFIPDAGNYTVTHIAIGRGGLQTSTSLPLMVTTTDAASGNMVKGSKFLTAEDHAQWTILHISGTATNWTFNEGSATIMGSGGNQQGIYQAVEVEANKKYKVDMKVKGSGATNTWFEVYVSPTAPTQNSDYSAGGKRIALNTWAGCGNTAFEGLLSQIGCGGDNLGPIVEFPTAGTVYLVIKSGGDNLGTTGITITNVELRGQAQ